MSNADSASTFVEWCNTDVMQLRTKDDLRTLYRPASAGPLAKVIDQIDEHCIEFLAKSPLMVLSTADADGVCDGSPKGGEPGFVVALDEQRVAWADSSGNNRLDSFENIVANPSVALLFLIPGLSETLRINGVAELSSDPELCARLTLGGRPAKVVVVVTVVEAYIHCAKAIRRAEVWDPSTWLAVDDVPDAVAMLRDHAAIEVSTEELRAGYTADVESTLWVPGGDAEG